MKTCDNAGDRSKLVVTESGMDTADRQQQMREPQQEHAAQPSWALIFSGRSRGRLYAAEEDNLRLPVTPAIWVIIWISVMVGYAGGYSDGASQLSHTSKPYRELFFPYITEAAAVQAARQQQQLFHAEHPEARLSDHHFTGIAWDIACQQQFAPPSWLALTWQYMAHIIVLPFAAWQARIHGRKAAVITGCCLQALGVSLKALSWHLPQLAVGYAIEGLGRGILWLAIAIEDAEIAPASVRGCFMTCNLLGTALGSLSAVAVFWEPHLQSADYGWRVATALNALPVCVVIILLPWFSESPNSLIQRGKLVEGREALVLIRGPFYDPTQELMDIVKGAGTDPFAGSSGHGRTGTTAMQCPANENNSNAVRAWHGTAAWAKLQLVAFKQRQHYLPMLVSCLLAVLSTVVCLSVEYSVLNVLTGDWIFSAKELAYTAIFVIAGVEVVSAAITMCTVDWIGRRGVWIISCLVGAACWAAFAASTALGQGENSYSTLSSASSATATLILLMFANFVGPFMLLPMLVTELHQLVVRTSAAAVVLSAAFCTRVMMLNTVFYTMCTLQWHLFVLMAAAYVGMLAIVVLLLPETKKVPLERIGGVWQKHWLWKRWLLSAATDAAAA